MTFSKEDILALKNYCQWITEHPRPIDKQLHVQQQGFLWCDDWRIIEILKYFFNGEPMYLSDPPPNRLKANPLWSKDVILAQAEHLYEEYKTAEGIINHFKQQRGCEYAGNP